jgi:hypothetical protein
MEEDGLTPLCALRKRAGTETARILIGAGACVDSADGKGWPAAHYAVARGDVEMLEVLAGAEESLEARMGDDWVDCEGAGGRCGGWASEETVSRCRAVGLELHDSPNRPYCPLRHLSSPHPLLFMVGSTFSSSVEQRWICRPHPICRNSKVFILGIQRLCYRQTSSVHSYMQSCGEGPWPLCEVAV